MNNSNIGEIVVSEGVESRERKWGMSSIWKNTCQRLNKQTKTTENDSSPPIQGILWLLMRINTKESLNKHIVVKPKEEKKRKTVLIKKIHYLQKNNNKTGSCDSNRNKIIQKTVEWLFLMSQKTRVIRILFPAKMSSWMNTK